MEKGKRGDHFRLDLPQHRAEQTYRHTEKRGRKEGGEKKKGGEKKTGKQTKFFCPIFPSVPDVGVGRTKGGKKRKGGKKKIVMAVVLNRSLKIWVSWEARGKGEKKGKDSVPIVLKKEKKEGGAPAYTMPTSCVKNKDE